MSGPERRRLDRLERRCDWLLARIAIGESKGRDMSHDIAELSALRWVMDAAGTQNLDLVAENERLKEKVNNQREEIRKLLARRQTGTVFNSKLEALVNAVIASPSAEAPADEPSHETGKGTCSR